MAIIDLFGNDAFGLTELTDVIQYRDYVPSGLRQFGNFGVKELYTPTATIEFGERGLKLIQTTNRGEPLEQLNKRDRHIRQYEAVRVGLASRIYASEIQFVRGFGKEKQMQMLSEEVADRLGLGGTNGLLDDVDVTIERMRLGALQGKVLDKDGTVLWDWSKEFKNAVGLGGTGTIASVAFNMSPAKDGDFKKELNNLKRSIAKQAKGVMFGTIGLLCGSEFFDAVATLPEVREANRNRPNQAMMQAGSGAYGEFNYAGFLFKEHRPDDDGDKVAIAPSEAVIFPKTSKGTLFSEYYAPAESFSDLGKKGKERYSQTLRDLQRNSYVDLEVLSYPLMVCKHPTLLRKGTIA